MLPSILTETQANLGLSIHISEEKTLIFCLVQWRQSVSFAQENANCLTTFFVVNSDDGDPIARWLLFQWRWCGLLCFISLSSDRRSIWNFLEQLNICKSCGQGSLTARLFKYCETSIFFLLFFNLFNEQKSMSSESLGLQSIFISPKIVEHIFPEPASFSSKLGTLPPYTALNPERKSEVTVFENEI